MSFVHTLSSCMLPETMTQCRRIIADGGTIVDQKWMDRVIRTMKAQGIYSSCKFLGDANFAYKNVASGVNTLYDVSGNNNDALQTTDANRPVWTAAQQGGRAGLVFDGNDDFLTCTSSDTDLYPEWTVISVAKLTNQGGFTYKWYPWSVGLSLENTTPRTGFGEVTFPGVSDDIYWVFTGNGQDAAGTFTNATEFNAYKILSFVLPSITNATFFCNGNTVSMANTTNTISARLIFTIGSAGVAGANFGAAETSPSHMIFTSALSTAQRTAMEQAINSYYAIY